MVLGIAGRQCRSRAARLSMKKGPAEAGPCHSRNYSAFAQ